MSWTGMTGAGAGATAAATNAAATAWAGNAGSSGSWNTTAPTTGASAWNASSSAPSAGSWGSGSASSSAWGGASGSASSMSFIGPLLGPKLIATWINSMLVGIVVWLFVSYVRRFWHVDRAWIKTLVIGVITFDALAWIASLISAYTDTVVHWGVFMAIGKRNPIVGVGMIAGAIGGCSVQTYLSYQAYRLLENVFLLVMMLALVATSFGAAIWTTYRFNATEFMAATSKQSRLASTVWLIVNFATDAFITGNLYYCLTRLQRGTTFSSTRSLIASVCLRLWETAAVTTTLALIPVIAYAVNTPIQFGQACGMLYSKTYLITLLINLGSRHFASNQTTSATFSGSRTAASMASFQPPSGPPASTEYTVADFDRMDQKA